MTLQSKEELLDNLNVEDCRVFNSAGNFNIRIMPTNPFYALLDVPNYFIENITTGKIEFSSDSLALCNHFLQFANSEGPQIANSLINEQGNETIN